jgi:hypothetical protein
MVLFKRNAMATITTPPKHFSIVLKDKVDEPINEPIYPPIKTTMITGRNAVISK